MELRWFTSAPASCFHAAAAMAAGWPLIDAPLEQALHEPVAGLAATAAARGLDAAELLRQLTVLSLNIENSAELAQTAVTKLVGRANAREHAQAIAPRLAAMKLAFCSIHPSATDELALRADPLRGQWEARGPGLLAAVARLIEPDVLVEQADVLLVQPVLGGGGEPFCLYNSVSMEAVLANPLAELPEVVRLAWLLAQLNLDLPALQGELIRGRLFEIGAVAFMPAVLEAAAYVELCGPPAELLPRALEAWRLPPCSSVVQDWWEAYRLNRPSWAAALGALAVMLSQVESAS